MRYTLREDGMTTPLATLFMNAFAQELDPPFAMLRSTNWSVAWQAREHLILRAKHAAEARGKSYRNFQVGAAALLSSTQPQQLKSRGQSPHVIYTGSNWKLGKDERNTCAEQEIVAQIRQQQHMFPSRRMLLLTIAGVAQDEPDAESGVRTPTLHPCRHCRKLLASVPEVRRDTVIITISQSTETMELMTFAELLRIHQTSQL